MIKSKFQHFQCCCFCVLHINKCEPFHEDYFIISSLFLHFPPRKNPQKKIRKHAKRILRNTFPQTPSISQNFARVPHLHFCTPPPLPPKHCGGVQSVLPHFCFSRSSMLRTEALQRAGNACGYSHEFLIK